jgi:hypothetical protein
MNLSRAAKKFRDQTPRKQPQPPRPAEPKKHATAAAPTPVAPQPVEPVNSVEPTPGPEAVTPIELAEATPAVAAPAKKVWPAKAKRRRFVREQSEKRERASGPTLPPRSTNFAARLLTRNLALPIAGDEPKASR